MAKRKSEGPYDIEILLVYRVAPPIHGEKTLKPEGGKILLDSELKAIFGPAYVGQFRRKTPLQPFHFNFEGTSRENEVRSIVQKIVADKTIKQKEKSTFALAERLSEVIDNRIGELLLTIAIGTSPQQKSRCAIWAYPSDSPLQFKVTKGAPKVREIHNAFSKSSAARKSIFFETDGSAGRNDLVRGEIFDSTAGRSRGTSDYWLKFLDGHIELRSARGTQILVDALKKADKACKNQQEKASVRSQIQRLIAGNLNSINLDFIRSQLLGEAQAEFDKTIPRNIDRNANFTIDQDLVAKKIKSRALILENGIEVFIPFSEEIHAEDFIIQKNDVEIFKIEEKILKDFHK